MNFPGRRFAFASASPNPLIVITHLAVVKSYYEPGGPWPPQYLAQTIVKVRIGPPKCLGQQGSKMMLEAWAPQYQNHDYAPAYPILEKT